MCLRLTLSNPHNILRRQSRTNRVLSLVLDTFPSAFCSPAAITLSQDSQIGEFAAGAASTRVSNALGQGRPNLARTAITAAFIVGTCSQSVIALTLFAGRSVWGYALSSDPVVVKRIAALLPFLALMVPCDGYNAIFSGWPNFSPNSTPCR